MTCAPPAPSPSSTGAPPTPVDARPDADAAAPAQVASPARAALRDLRARAGWLLAATGRAAAGVWRRCRGRPAPLVADGLVVEALLADRRRARNLERRLREGLVRLRRPSRFLGLLPPALVSGPPDTPGSPGVRTEVLRWQP